MKKIVFVFVVICCLPVLRAQNPGYKISFDQIFDNREYFSDYAFPQTIFASRIDAQLLFPIDTVHSFAAGMNYMYEYGSKLLGVDPQIDLYYNYNTESLKMTYGSFPRRDLLDMPLYFLSDTLNYYRPNIEGAFIQYCGSKFEVSGFVDWTGRVSEDRRETFLVGLDSKFRLDGFYLQPTFLMYHNARSYSSTDTIHLQDNGMMSFLIGYDLENEEHSMKLNFSTGVLASYNRFRPDDLNWGRGIVSNLNLTYHIFALKGVYYHGSPLHFEYGDSFYSAGKYGRIDIFVDPMKHRKVRSKFGWCFHMVPGEGIHHSQQILISLTF